MKIEAFETLFSLKNNYHFFNFIIINVNLILFFYLEISITVNVGIVAVQSKPPVKFYQGEKFK